MIDLTGLVRRAFAVVYQRQVSPVRRPSNVPSPPRASFGGMSRPGTVSDQIEAEVHLLYRALLGRQPDPQGLAFYTDLLSSGHSFRDAFYTLTESAEFQAARRAIGDIYDSGGASLPFTLIEGPATSSHMLVGFPTLGVHAQSGRAHEDYRFRRLRAHRLYVGAGKDLLLGLSSENRGAELACELIDQETKRLGLTREHVICWGHSYAASCALYVALTYGAGNIVVGAPTIRLGTWADQYARRVRSRGSRVELAERLRRLGGLDDIPDARRKLDRVIAQAAHASRFRQHLRILLSSDDSMRVEVEGLIGDLRGHPTIRCQVDYQNYGAHDQLEETFYSYLASVLSTSFDLS
jgi:hypothetical protein